MSLFRQKVPAVIASGLICFALGSVATYGTMLAMGYQPKSAPIIRAVVKKSDKKKDKDKERASRRAEFQRMLSKYRLVSLVRRLDVLTSPAPILKLSEEQQTKLAEYIKDLDKLKELKADDAKQRYEDIFSLLKDQQTTLKAVGIRAPDAKLRWPTDTPNPFAEGKNRERLESLQKRFPLKS